MSKRAPIGAVSQKFILHLLLSLMNILKITKPRGLTVVQKVLMQGKLAEAFNQTVSSVFNDEQPYQLVAAPDANTLIVETYVTDIRLAAPIESSRRSFQSGGATYTQNSGSMVLLARIKDGKDNTVIAKAADRGQAMDQ
eukprot:TRINITY_DN713_c0_g2_i1.p1 TRINITY_DN713_c0_g2~~TRINITY_DN713_c0_g2_i1.p1  ORF type:complete len:139 (+),score=17.76 TRINITY_DN713_c0_g2_i1:379-795(+)